MPFVLLCIIEIWGHSTNILCNIQYITVYFGILYSLNALILFDASLVYKLTYKVWKVFKKNWTKTKKKIKYLWDDLMNINLENSEKC